MFAVTHAEPVRVGVRSTRIGPATPAAPRWMCIAIGASMLLCRWATHTWPLAGRSVSIAAALPSGSAGPGTSCAPVKFANFIPADADGTPKATNQTLATATSNGNRLSLILSSQIVRRDSL